MPIVMVHGVALLADLPDPLPADRVEDRRNRPGGRIRRHGSLRRLRPIVPLIRAAGGRRRQLATQSIHRLGECRDEIRQHGAAQRLAERDEIWIALLDPCHRLVPEERLPRDRVRRGNHPLDQVSQPGVLSAEIGPAQ
jgi:hypothetical protein